MADLVELRRGSLSASILTSQGFNCFRLTVDGRSTIWAPPEHAGGNCHPACGGVPLLYPFPGRLAAALLHWRGASYQMEAGDAAGHAIHGFVYDRPWRLTQASQDRAAAVFQLSRDAPDRRSQWPADFRIEAEYRLLEDGVRFEAAVCNTGSAPMPSGFGAHPYFSLPAGEDSVVKLPVSTQWELEQMLPSGACHELPDPSMLQAGQPMQELHLDAVFGGLVPSKTGSASAGFEASITDPRGGRGTRLCFGEPFRELVVYTPGDRQSICIEPLSCVPGAVDMGERAGWETLAPGDETRYAFEIRLTAAGDCV